MLTRAQYLNKIRSLSLEVGFPLAAFLSQMAVERVENLSDADLSLLYCTLLDNKAVKENIDQTLLDLFALAGYEDKTHGGDPILGNSAETEISRFYKEYGDTFLTSTPYTWYDYGSKFRLAFTYKQETQLIEPAYVDPLAKIYGKRLVNGSNDNIKVSKPRKAQERKVYVGNERDTPKGASLPSEAKWGFRSQNRFALNSGDFEEATIIEGNFLPVQAVAFDSFISTAELLTNKPTGAYYVLDHVNKRKIRIPDTFLIKGERVQQTEELRRKFAAKIGKLTSIAYFTHDTSQSADTDENVRRIKRREATRAQTGYGDGQIKKAKSKISSGGKNPNSFSSTSESLAKHALDPMIALQSRSYKLEENICLHTKRKLPKLTFRLTISKCGSFIYLEPQRGKLTVFAKVAMAEDGYMTVVPVKPIEAKSQDSRIWSCVLKYVGLAEHTAKDGFEHDELGCRVAPKVASERLTEIRSMLTPHKPFEGIHAVKVERKQKAKADKKRLKVSVR